VRRIAGRYAEHFAPLTRLALGPLLDAVRVAAGRRVLDVATGPGVAAALGRGATVTGVDVSPAMVTEAQRAHPGVEFRLGDCRRTRMCRLGMTRSASPPRRPLPRCCEGRGYARQLPDIPVVGIWG
jgi:SAM-dependent methyltransferase